MDKKVSEVETKEKRVRKKIKIDKKLAYRALVVVVAVIGVVIFCFGAVKIHKYYNMLGTKTIEELNTNIVDLSKKYQEVEKEKIEEMDNNGFSDKYFELDAKSMSIRGEISKDTNSRYMKETGYHNPKSFYDMLVLAPELWIGVSFVIAAMVGTYVLKKKER